MYLIKELHEDVEVITEDYNGEKHRYISGIFLQGDLVNKNRRCYPFEILQNEVQRYVRESVVPKRAYGELNHPKSSQINLERVSHLITELKPNGKNFYGKAVVMKETPYGKIVNEMLNYGAKLGVSSRGYGSVTEKNGVNYVQSDFRLATAADIVADPSAPDAFVQGLMEQKDWVWNDEVWIPKQLEAAQKRISATQAKKLYETKVKIFKEFMDML